MLRRFAQPVNPFQICQRNGWHVQKYSVLAAKLGVSVQKICTVLGSKDGVSIKKGQGYHILYNDIGNTQERIRFTVTHEIGHVYLGHLEFDETSLGASLTKEEYQVLENEANAFSESEVIVQQKSPVGCFPDEASSTYASRFIHIIPVIE